VKLQLMKFEAWMKLLVIYAEIFAVSFFDRHSNAKFSSSSCKDGFVAWRFCW